MMKRLGERIAHWLLKRTRRQWIGMLAGVYIFVILVVSVCFLLGKLNLFEVAITLLILLAALLPLHS